MNLQPGRHPGCPRNHPVIEPKVYKCSSTREENETREKPQLQRTLSEKNFNSLRHPSLPKLKARDNRSN